MELVARCSEAAKHLKAVIDQLRSWPRIDRPHPADRVPIMIEQRLGPTSLGELISAYGTGASTRQLAARFGIAKSSVVEVLRRQGITLRPRGVRY